MPGRFRDPRRAPARDQPVRRAGAPEGTIGATRLPALALQPLHRRGLPARSGRRPDVQRRRREHAAQQRANGVQATAPVTLTTRHIAARGSVFQRERPARQRLAGLPADAAGNQTTTCRSTSSTTRAHRRRRCSASYLQDEWRLDRPADRQLRPALRPGGRRVAGGPAAARASVWCTGQRRPGCTPATRATSRRRPPRRSTPPAYMPSRAPPTRRRTTPTPP